MLKKKQEQHLLKANDPKDDLCFSFLLKSAKLPDFTIKATFTSSSPRSFFLSFPGLSFNLYHLKNKENFSNVYFFYTNSLS